MRYDLILSPKFQRILTRQKMKPLIILDLNGVFYYKIPKDKDDTKNKTNVKMINIGYHNVYIRPNIEKFLSWLFKTYSVAIFSSTTYYNVNIMLEKILTLEQRKKLVFLWCRSHCTLDPDYGINEEIKFYDTVKLFTTVVNNPFNENRIYTVDNVLFLDDSLKKMRYNPNKTYFILDSYHPDNEVCDINDVSIIIDLLFGFKIK